MRLKGGDPFVFGRGGEEAEALAAAGIPFEVVPGITSAIGAAAYAGIPVTHRGLSTHFTVVTGHEDPTKDRTDVDWAALARAGGTLVILMGAGRIGEIARRLIDGGRAPDTPVAAVRNGTRPDQTHRAGHAGHGRRRRREGTERDRRRRRRRASTSSWFERRPLFGRTVVVTRAREQVSGLRLRLEELGAEVLELPAIEIAPIDVAVPDLSAYEWLVFTSPNGVRAFFHDGLAPAGLDARALAGVRLAAIGPGTAHALADARPARRPGPRALRGRVAAGGVPTAVGAGRARVAGSGRGGARHPPRRARRARLRGRRAPRVPHRAGDARSRDGRARASRAGSTR